MGKNKKSKSKYTKKHRGKEKGKNTKKHTRNRHNNVKKNLSGGEYAGKDNCKKHHDTLTKINTKLDEIELEIEALLGTSMKIPTDSKDEKYTKYFGTITSPIQAGLNEKHQALEIIYNQKHLDWQVCLVEEVIDSDYGVNNEINNPKHKARPSREQIIDAIEKDPAGLSNELGLQTIIETLGFRYTNPKEIEQIEQDKKLEASMQEEFNKLNPKEKPELPPKEKQKQLYYQLSAEMGIKEARAKTILDENGENIVKALNALLDDLKYGDKQVYPIRRQTSVSSPMWENTGTCLSGLIGEKTIDGQKISLYWKETGGRGDCLYYSLNAALSQFALEPDTLSKYPKLQILLKAMNASSSEVTSDTLNELCVMKDDATLTLSKELIKKLIASGEVEGEVEGKVEGEGELRLPTPSDLATRRAFNLRFEVARNLKIRGNPISHLDWSDPESNDVTQAQAKEYWTRRGLNEPSELASIIPEEKSETSFTKDDTLYLAKIVMGRLGRWGSEIDLQILAELADINIFIINGRPQVPESPHLFYNLYGGTIEDIDKIDTKKPLILLNYIGGHYQVGGILDNRTNEIKSSFLTRDPDNLGVYNNLQQIINSKRVGKSALSRYQRRMIKNGMGSGGDEDYSDDSDDVD